MRYAYIDDVASTFSGWIAKVTVDTDSDTREIYEVFLPEKWYENEDLAMEVCAYSGYYFSTLTDDSRTAVINALGVAEKIWRWGDLAIRYLIEYVGDYDLDEATDTIVRYGGSVTLLENNED